MSMSLDASVSGMVEQQRNMELIANNLANVNTNGYKRLTVHFQDVLSNVSAVAAQNGDANAAQGALSAAGVSTAAVSRYFGQGQLMPSPRPLDFAISGDGFFRVLLEDGSFGYTRDGAFYTGVDGRLTTVDGYVLDPPVTVPVVFSDLKMTEDGTISVNRPLTEAELATLQPGDPRDGRREVVGQIRLVRFPNPVGLTSIGQSLFAETEDSQAPIEGVPNVDGMGAVYSGWVEGSNVDIGLEMTNLSLANRSYVLNFTAFRTIEEMLRQAGQVTGQ